MPITKQDRQELDQLHKQWSDTYLGCKEDYFACLYLTKKFHCSVSDIAHQVSFGNHDYGLDAFYIDREAKNLFLYQFKWSDNHDLFRDSLDRLASDGMQRIFGNPMADSNVSPLLSALRAELYENKAVIDRVYVHFVFKGDREKAENSKGLENRKENLENKSHLVHSYFGKENVELIVEFVTERRAEQKAKPAECHEVRFTDYFKHSTADGKTMYVGKLALIDLHRIYKSLEFRFLDRNIRLGLSSDNPPNTKIREALTDIVIKQKMAPDVFCFNHNGITLAAEDLVFEGGKTIIKVPRLLNGAQTVTSVEKFLKDKAGNPALTDNAHILGAIQVLAKIVVDNPSSDFVANITICNNRQNPVAPWNLRANDKIQCDLHDKFLKEIAVFYSRQEKAFENLTYEDLVDAGFDEANYDMKIRPLAQTFLAIQGEIARMSDMPEVFGNQRWYDETFREAYLNANAQKILIAYKVNLVLRSPMDRISESTSLKVGKAVTKARNLVWALLVQAIFNDPKLSARLEDFGAHLRRETAFREYLKTLASSKLVPIFKDLLASREYRERMEKEKYEFLRTREIFNQCMDIASDRFEWAKKYI